MSLSPIGHPRPRAVLLTLALATLLLAAGCSHMPYPPPGKSFRGSAQSSAAPQPETAPQAAKAAPAVTAPKAAPEATAKKDKMPTPLVTAAPPEAVESEAEDAETSSTVGFLKTLPSRTKPAETPATQPARAASDETSAAKDLHFAAGRGEAQVETQPGQQLAARPAQPAAAPRPSEIADPPMPSAPLGKAAAAAPRDDKPAGPAMTKHAAQKPQPEAAAPVEPLQAGEAQPEPAQQPARVSEPKTTAPEVAAPTVAPTVAPKVAAAPRVEVPKPTAPAAPIAPQAAPPAAVEPASASVEPQTLRERAANLFLKTDSEPAASPAPQPKAETPAAAAPQPAQLNAAPVTPPQPAEPATDADAEALPEVSVSEAPLKLPPESRSESDPQTEEELTAAAEVSPAAGSGDNTVAAVEIANPSGQTRVLFDEDSAVLSKEAQAELAKLASRIPDPAQFRITILGYGDGSEQSTDAGRARVLALSRVMAVRQFLMVRGLPAERLAARAMGNQMTDGPSSRVDVMVSQL